MYTEFISAEGLIRDAAKSVQKAAPRLGGKRQARYLLPVKISVISLWYYHCLILS